MKRADKRTLLTKLLKGQTNRQQLEQAINPVPPFLLMLYDLNHPGHTLTDSTIVHFQDRGQTHCMSYAESMAYTNQHQIKTVVTLPDKHSMYEATLTI